MIKLLSVSLFFLFSICGCKYREVNKGFFGISKTDASVCMGMQEKCVLEKVGVPSFKSHFGKNWYYISTKVKKSNAIFSKDTAVVNYIQLTFDQDGKLIDILKEEGKNANSLSSVSDQKTPIIGINSSIKDKLAKYGKSLKPRI